MTQTGYEIAKLHTEFAKAKKERDEANALLRELEWSARDGCPICFHGNLSGHAPGCRLDAYLKGQPVEGENNE